MTANENAPARHPVIVGVAPGQPTHVVEQAARFAAQFGTDLICAHVNPGRYAVDEAIDGSVVSSSIDPDFVDNREEVFDANLAASLAAVLANAGISWRTLVLAGDVATALGHLAETVDAAMIVVGTHDASMSGGIQEFFNRSVATGLAHHQHRPVVVIPTHSHGSDAPKLGKK
ncbi:universal stress protein [Glaciibacter psychrotolerans]|uniref:Nucleotide-binding universal stress UspA family protein n=1 Tax=Glaciibacter psychrotolerans TaxID=670054 RepID=A0A7Z0J528_9MICO|nr:universal stress protein [Leifsonia psychrotolerans]NYJ18741.1 nucleotide-binding universal stress UspA family protein [Leifsonia psychrotolerans]